MNQALRALHFKYHHTPDQPFSLIQKAAMVEIKAKLEKFYNVTMREELLFTVTPFRDHEKGRMMFHGLDCRPYKRYIGAAKFKLHQLLQQYGGELTRILQVAVQFNLILRIEPDTTQVYHKHTERPLVISFRPSVKPPEEKQVN